MSKMLVILIVVGMACMVAWPVAAGTFKVELEITYDVSSTIANGVTMNQANVTEMRVLQIKGAPSVDPGGETSGPPGGTAKPPWLVEREDLVFGRIIPEIGVAVSPGDPDPCGYVWNPVTQRYYYRCW